MEKDIQRLLSENKLGDLILIETEILNQHRDTFLEYMKKCSEPAFKVLRILLKETNFYHETIALLYERFQKSRRTVWFHILAYSFSSKDIEPILDFLITQQESIEMLNQINYHLLNDKSKEKYVKILENSFTKIGFITAKDKSYRLLKELDLLNLDNPKIKRYHDYDGSKTINWKGLFSSIETFTYDDIDFLINTYFFEEKPEDIILLNKIVSQLLLIKHRVNESNISYTINTILNKYPFFHYEFDKELNSFFKNLNFYYYQKHYRYKTNQTISIMIKDRFFKNGLNDYFLYVPPQTDDRFVRTLSFILQHNIHDLNKAHNTNYSDEHTLYAHILSKFIKDIDISLLNTLFLLKPDKEEQLLEFFKSTIQLLINNENVLLEDVEFE